MAEINVGTVLDKAAKADREALFAALQKAISEIIHYVNCVDRRGIVSLNESMKKIDRALEIGAPIGSSKQLRATSAEE